MWKKLIWSQKIGLFFKFQSLTSDFYSSVHDSVNWEIYLVSFVILNFWTKFAKKCVLIVPRLNSNSKFKVQLKRWQLNIPKSNCRFFCNLFVKSLVKRYKFCNFWLYIILHDFKTQSKNKSKSKNGNDLTNFLHFHLLPCLRRLAKVLKYGKRISHAVITGKKPKKLLNWPYFFTTYTSFSGLTLNCVKCW